MDNKSEPKTMFSDVYEQLAKDLPIILKLRELEDNNVDKYLINSSEKYLDLLCEAYVVFDINPKDLSPIEESVAISDKLMSVTNKFQLKRTNDWIDKSLEELQTNVHSLKEKFSDSVREMKSQTLFETEMSEKINFYSNKSKEYYNCVKNREKSLSKIGFTSDIKQESIQQIRQNNEELRNQLNDTNARLNEYKDFIPTENDLKNKIKDLRLELSSLDHIFNKI